MVAQVEWLSAVRRLRGPRNLDEADAAAGPALRAAGCRYGFRAADRAGWCPVFDEAGFVAALAGLASPVCVAPVAPPAGVGGR